MNSFLRLAFVLVIIPAGLAAAAPAFDADRVRAEIVRLDAGRFEALVKGDVPALEKLYADDLVYIHANGRIDSKKPFLATLTGGTTYVSLQYDAPPKIIVAGPDVGIVTGKANIAVKNKAGQVTKRALTTTTVYVRTAAGWRVVSYQGTPAQ